MAVGIAAIAIQRVTHARTALVRRGIRAWRITSKPANAVRAACTGSAHVLAITGVTCPVPVGVSTPTIHRVTDACAAHGRGAWRACPSGCQSTQSIHPAGTTAAERAPVLRRARPRSIRQTTEAVQDFAHPGTALLIQTGRAGCAVLQTASQISTTDLGSAHQGAIGCTANRVSICQTTQRINVTNLGSADQCSGGGATEPMPIGQSALPVNVANTGPAFHSSRFRRAGGGVGQSAQEVGAADTGSTLEPAHVQRARPMAIGITTQVFIADKGIAFGGTQTGVTIG